MRRVKKTKFSNVTNTQICLIFFDYAEVLRSFFTAFRFSSAETTTGLEEEIKAILGRRMPESAVLEAFVTLSTPPELDETMLERLDWLVIHAEKDATDSLLLKHALKYPSFFFNVYDEREVVSFLRSKLQNEAHDRQEEAKIRKNIRQIKKRQTAIYRQFADARLKECAKLIQNLGTERFKLKLCWGGAEYLALPMFREIAKRNFIPLRDIFSAYDARDIEALLLKGNKLSAEEVKARKEFYCIFFEGKQGDYTRLSGKAAKAKTMEVLRGSLPKNRKELTGQVANPGTAKGKARVVLVSGLKGLERDLREFRENEVLVTTMTTPNMVLIAKKASAIVTDEGGICSHAAITSREFGIPCIVGTRDATKVIWTGDWIEVDGTTGTVRKVSKN